MLVGGCSVSKGGEVGLPNEQWRLDIVRAVTATVTGRGGEDSLRVFE